MIVGLDISTSCIGICLLNDDGSFHSIHHVELKKEKNFYKKVDKFLDFILKDLKLTEHECKFFVEEPLKMFKFRASMAQTIALLQRFNASCCFMIYWTWLQEPNLISVVSARKTLGIVLPKKRKTKDTKQMVFEAVKAMNVIPEDAWTYKKTGRPKDWVYDRVDAYVIARAAYEGMKNEQKGGDKKEKAKGRIPAN